MVISAGGGRGGMMLEEIYVHCFFFVHAQTKDSSLTTGLRELRKSD